MNHDVDIGGTRCPQCGFQRTTQQEPCIRCNPFKPLFHELGEDVLKTLHDVVQGALKEAFDNGMLNGVLSAKKRELFDQLGGLRVNETICRGYQFDRFETRRGGMMGPIDYVMTAWRGGEEATVVRRLHQFHAAPSAGHAINEMLAELDEALRPARSGLDLIIHMLSALVDVFPSVGKSALRNVLSETVKLHDAIVTVSAIDIASILRRVYDGGAYAQHPDHVAMRRAMTIGRARAMDLKFTDDEILSVARDEVDLDGDSVKGVTLKKRG